MDNSFSLQAGRIQDHECWESVDCRQVSERIVGSSLWSSRSFIVKSKKWPSRDHASSSSSFGRSTVGSENSPSEKRQIDSLYQNVSVPHSRYVDMLTILLETIGCVHTGIDQSTAPSDREKRCLSENFPTHLTNTSTHLPQTGWLISLIILFKLFSLDPC